MLKLKFMRLISYYFQGKFSKEPTHKHIKDLFKKNKIEHSLRCGSDIKKRCSLRCFKEFRKCGLSSGIILMVAFNVVTLEEIISLPRMNSYECFSFKKNQKKFPFKNQITMN